jgi:hypothetical protein
LEFNSDKHIKTEPTEENHSDIEQNQNIESKDRNPVKIESAKKLDILNPEDEDTEEGGGNSALQAMESLLSSD